MSGPHPKRVNELSRMVREGLDNPTPEIDKALHELTAMAHAYAVLANRKKPGKVSQEGKVMNLAFDLARELIDGGKASAGPGGVVLPRGFAAELSRRCDFAGIEMDKRRVEMIVKKTKIYIQTK